MALQENSAGLPERTYHGVVPVHEYKKVIIKEEGMRDALLQGLDGSQDFNWGYGGGGPTRLANSLAADAFDDVTYADAFGWHFSDGLVRTFKKDHSFEVSRDRIVLEGLIAFQDMVNKSRSQEGRFFMEVIQQLIARRHDTRDKMMSLLSRKALTNLTNSRYGLK